MKKTLEDLGYKVINRYKLEANEDNLIEYDCVEYATKDNPEYNDSNKVININLTTGDIHPYVTYKDYIDSSVLLLEETEACLELIHNYTRYEMVK